MMIDEYFKLFLLNFILVLYIFVHIIKINIMKIYVEIGMKYIFVDDLYFIFSLS